MRETSDLTQDEIDAFVGAAHGSFAQVKTLLAEKPDLLHARSRLNESALDAAAHMGRQEMAEYLLAAGAPLDIYAASALGYTDRAAQFLRDDPALAKTSGIHGFPILFFPAIGGHIEIAEMLILQGADINAGGGGINTALHGAIGWRQKAMAEWLLARGANIDARGYQDMTPLQAALANEQNELADLLRRWGATG